MVPQQAKKATAIARGARIGIWVKWIRFNMMEFKVIKTTRIWMIMENNMEVEDNIAPAISMLLISIMVRITQRVIVRRTRLLKEVRRGIIATITIATRWEITIRRLNIIIIQKCNTPVQGWIMVTEGRRTKGRMVIASISSTTKVATTRSRWIEESRSNTPRTVMFGTGVSIQITMNTSKTMTMIRESISTHRHRRASRREEVLSLRAKMLLMANRINTIRNLATRNIQPTLQSHRILFRHCAVTSLQTRWREAPRITITIMVGFTEVAHTSTTKTMWLINNQGTKDQRNNQANRKRKASAQEARKAPAQEGPRSNPTPSSWARAIESDGITFATSARLISKTLRRSFIHAIANIRFVTSVTIIKYRPKRGSALTVASTMR